MLEALVLSGYTRQIFPNIRHLSIVLQENQPRYIKIVNSLMSPRINSIGIRYFSTATMLDSAVSSIIYILQEAKFPLVKLTIDAGNSGNGVSQATWKAQSRFLASLTSLRRLVLRGLSKETFPLFVVASQLPELVDLKIETPHAWIELLERADVVHETGFTVLKRLIVDNSQAQSSRAVLLAFLPCFASTTFEELQVSFPPIFDQTNRGDLIPLQQFGALTTFEANWRNQGDLRREDVGHLFESHLLTHVSLVGEGAATLFDNKMIHWAAEAWPHLQALAIVEWDGELAESTPYNLSLPTVTLQGLAPLAVYCPSLQSISIHIDARNTPSSTVSTPGLSVQKLVFRDSHIGERIDEVAAFITCMWPNVELDSKRIMEEWYQGDRASRREQEFGARWRQVWEKVAKSSGEKLKLVGCSLSAGCFRSHIIFVKVR